MAETRHAKCMSVEIRPETHTSVYTDTHPEASQRSRFDCPEGMTTFLPGTHTHTLKTSSSLILCAELKACLSGTAICQSISKQKGIPLHVFTPSIQYNLGWCIELSQPGSLAGVSSPHLLLAPRPLCSNVLPEGPRKAGPERRTCSLIPLSLSELGAKPVFTHVQPASSASSIPELLQA